MVYVRRTKDKDADKKRKKDTNKYDEGAVISYKKSKKKKIRRNQDDKSPAYVFTR